MVCLQAEPGPAVRSKHSCQGCQVFWVWDPVFCRGPRKYGSLQLVGPENLAGATGGACSLHSFIAACSGPRNWQALLEVCDKRRQAAWQPACKSFEGRTQKCKSTVQGVPV